MMDGFITYLTIGVIWCFITDFFFTDMELSNGARLRYTLLWPVTFLAFVMGLIDSIKNRNEEM
tara:strand:+ start:1463 stop:1651 length:189 start_codon:yes stop_codon:yes gene_type:complete